jgi:hypothetical protein
VAYAEGIVYPHISLIPSNGSDIGETLLVYTNDISTGIGMVYSAPAAPIKVAFTVGVELMGTWVPDKLAHAYAARRVLQSVMATMYAAVEQGWLEGGNQAIGRRKGLCSYIAVCWVYAVEGGLR